MYGQSCFGLLNLLDIHGAVVADSGLCCCFYCFIIRKMRQFNTFAANSPSHSGYYSPTANSPKFIFPSNADSRNQDPKSTLLLIDTFKKIQSPEVLREEPAEEPEDVEDDNHSQISQLLSQISVPGAQRPQYEIKRLFSLQNNITQHILQLREQKITLMQELSKLIDNKNIYEHYLLKKTKQLDDRQTAYDSRINQTPKSPEEEIVPTHISSQILKRNEELHLKLKELQIKEEIFGPSFGNEEIEESSKKTLDEIMHVRDLNNKVKADIASKLKKIEKDKDSRLITFQPQDKQKHLQPSPLEELQELKEKYANLVSQAKEPVFKLSEQEIAYIESLRQETQELQRQAEEMLRIKQTSNLSQLRTKLQENEKQKSIFLGQLQKFKSSMKAVKDENTRLKRELHF